MIGVFDSGSGGLTVLKALRKEMPKADFVYFGDIKNAPYGNKSQEELSKLTVDAIKLLQDNGAKNIVSACNSLSAPLAMSLANGGSIQAKNIIEMVGPTVTYLKNDTSRLALCATEATINSGIYQNGFNMVGKDIDCFSITDLAGAIEFGEPKESLERIIEESLSEYKDKFDKLILACTHFPLAIDSFEKVIGKPNSVFDPAVAVAKRASEAFIKDAEGSGSIHFIISQDSEFFRSRVEDLFCLENASIEVLI